MRSPTQVRVDAVIFDLGGVITIRPQDFVTRFATDCGIPVTSLGAAFTEGHEGFAAMELGEMPMSEFLDQVCADLSRRHGVAVDSARLNRCVHDSLWPSDEMLRLIAEIRRSHKTAILTNNNPELTEVWRPRLPADVVDLIVDSSAVGMRKPDRAIYEYTVLRLGTTPNRAVFVDDTPMNVEAARAYGMPAVLFENPEKCRRELLEFGVQLHAGS